MQDPVHAVCPRCGAVSTEGRVCAGCAFATATDRNDAEAILELNDLCPRPADPELIGRYRVLQRIGEGGMGIVYKAEQQDALKRIVAVKVIRAGLDSREVVARFELERQALTLMNHPNIAQVFDAGTATDGRPFFAMEFVEGIPITTFCNQRRYTTHQRIDLFVVLCNAVQHAHQKGIIHRDLKPSNILVTDRDGVPTPKIIDFGVAKAAEQRLSGATLHTRLQQFIGTPAYMSPEQAELGRVDIDTRSDIYSLGVLLYELLAGHAPFDPAKLLTCGFDEMRRIVREVEPAPPSTRLSTLGDGDAHRIEEQHGEPACELASRLTGDVDCIVMKALEKDRSRRYDTALELARDLQRYIAHEPVIARPPSAAYRVRKMVRRHKALCSAAVAVALALIAGAALSLWQASRARKAEASALSALNELRAAAPTFAQQARALAAKSQFAEAVEKLDYALQLCPDSTEYAALKGDYLESQMKFGEAAQAYAGIALREPANRRAAVHANLCKELAASQNGDTFSMPLLNKLYEQMREERRLDAEVLPISRLLGREQSHLIAATVARLQPLWPDIPLQNRITVESTGLLRMDLGLAPVADLSPLQGLPIGVILTGGGRMQNNLLTSLDFIGGLPDLHDLRINGQHRITDFSGLKKGRRLQSLHMWGTRFSDASLLNGLPLTTLGLRATRVLDLRPLAALPLRSLDLTDIPATDFTPLAGLPLEELNLSGTRITDLACLAGMPLHTLRLDGCAQMRNLRVLATLPKLKNLGLPTDIFSFAASEVNDLAALRRSPTLERISVGPSLTLREMPAAGRFWSQWDESTNVMASLRAAGIATATVTRDGADTWGINLIESGTVNLAVIPTNLLPSIGSIVLPKRTENLDVLRGLPRLKQVAWRVAKDGHIPFQAGTEFWRDWDDLVCARQLRANGVRFAVGRWSGSWDISVLDSSFANASIFAGTELGMLSLADTAVSDLTPLAGAKIDVLVVTGTKVSDLTPLASVPIRRLYMDRTAVSNLEPLRGKKLLNLHLLDAPVASLEPVRGQPIETLSIGGTLVSDLTPLTTMPLKALVLGRCKNVTDVSALAAIPTLESVILPEGASGVDALRTLPKLKYVTFRWDQAQIQSAADFWREWDATHRRAAK